MSYILGFLSSDGCIYKNKRGSSYIAFYSADLEIIENIKKIMGVSNKIQKYLRKPHKKAYILQIGSKKIFESLINLGLTPNKSKTLTLPKIPNEFFCHFLRGYFDGDGCAFYRSYKRKDRRNGPYNIASFRLTSGSKNFLIEVKNKLEKDFKISKGSLYKKKGAYDLAFSGRNVLELYSFIYPSLEVPHLARKRMILDKYRNNWGRSSVG
jgi:intein-encoded DNA endonuclease-like protein